MILSADPREVAPSRIKNIAVLATWVGGVNRFERGSGDWGDWNCRREAESVSSVICTASGVMLCGGSDRIIAELDA